MAVLKGYAEFVIYKCGRIFGVSYFRPYAKTKSNGGERKSALNGFNLGLGSDQMVLKSQVSLSRSFLALLVFLLMSQLMSCKCFLVVL